MLTMSVDSRNSDQWEGEQSPHDRVEYLYFKLTHQSINQRHSLHVTSEVMTDDIDIDIPSKKFLIFKDLSQSKPLLKNLSVPLVKINAPAPFVGNFSLFLVFISPPPLCRHSLSTWSSAEDSSESSSGVSLLSGGDESVICHIAGWGLDTVR